MFQITMLQKIVTYEQFSQQNTGEPPRDYYDPNIMMSTKNFSIRPGEELLVVISGNGFKYMDDSIFQLVHDEETHTYFAEMGSQQLAYLVKNCSVVYTIYVGYKTPLKWLLDMPRITAKLCYGSLINISHSSSKPLNDDDLYATDGAIFIV
jgi:hypothetical protein